MFGIFDKWIPKPELKQRSKSGQQNGNLPDPQPPFRLSIITQFYRPDYAASGHLIEDLASELGQQGMKIDIFTGQPGYASQQEFAATVERLDNLKIRRSRTTRLWPQRIRGKAINGLLFCLRSGLHLLKNCWHSDILLVTTAPPFLPILGYLANLCFGFPYVCVIYDLYPDVAIALNVISPNHFVVKFWDFINRRIWQNAKGIVVLNSTMKDRVVAKCPEIIDKISVIPSSADPNWIQPIDKKDNWFANQHNLVEKFTVLYSGNMGRCHDMDTIMEAAEQLQNDPMIQFVFLGGGAKRQSCLEKVRALGLKNCLFLPYHDRQLLPYLLTACDLSLVSIDQGLEGLIVPSKLYGFLAAGRPIAAICEPHSYLHQLIADAKCGAAFNNGDAMGLAKFIQTLAIAPQQASEMGRAGRHYLMSHFTHDIIAQQYWQLLASNARLQSNGSTRQKQPTTGAYPETL